MDFDVSSSEKCRDRRWVMERKWSSTMKIKQTKSLKNLAFLLGASLVLTACGKGEDNKFVTDVRLFTFVEDDNAWVELQADINTGDAALPAIEFPVAHPRDPDLIYGQIAVKPILGGGSEIDLGVNLTAVLGEPLTDRRMPNGLEIPVGGLDPNTILAYNIKNGPSKVFTAFTGNDGILGTAIVIPQMDRLGREIGRTNFFPQFNHSTNQVLGVAGLFTGPNPNESGFGVFADLGTIADRIRANLSGENIGDPEVGPYFSLSFSDSYPTFDPVDVSWRKQLKIGKHLKRLDRKKVKLDIR